MSKVCKYGCGVELGQFSTKENKFLETDNKTLHTRDRCESLKQKSVPNNGNDLSVEVLIKRLGQLGISIHLQKLRNI